VLAVLVLLGFPRLGLSLTMTRLVGCFFRGVGSIAALSGCFFGGFGSLCVICTHLDKCTGPIGGMGDLILDISVLFLVLCVARFPLKRVGPPLNWWRPLFFKVRLLTHGQVRTSMYCDGS